MFRLVPPLDTQGVPKSRLHHTVVTCDPEVVGELLARQDDFPKLWGRQKSEKALQGFAGDSVGRLGLRGRGVSGWVPADTLACACVFGAWVERCAGVPTLVKLSTEMFSGKL